MSVQDEIELISFLHAFWQKKWFIFFLSVLTTCGYLIPLFFQTPVYEAKATLVSPMKSDLLAINGEQKSIARITTDEAFYTFRTVLFAEATMKQFRSKLPESQTKTSSLIIEPDKFGRSVIISRAVSPQDASEGAKKFINLAHQLALNELNRLVDRKVKIAKLKLEEKINLVRETVNRKKENQLVRLEDALHIAKAIKLEQPQPFFVVDVDIHNPAYLRGSKALEAEIDSLKKQLSNDAFIPELIKLHYQANKLNFMKPAYEDVILGKLNGEIIVSDKPIRLFVKRKMLLSCLLGLMLGLMLVAIRQLKQDVKAIAPNN